ncbi:MAG: FHIPEP family type III secretion protein, partial [Pseudomonadota bacterium]
FVKGDATAGLIIIFINLIGGIAVGTGVHGLSLGEAASIYSLLTIGDGLVAQIPALLMSICAGVIVTRVANEKPQDLGSDIAKELMSDARVPAAASIIIFLFGFVPGFPFFVFAIASVALFVASLLVKAAVRKAAEDSADSAETVVEPEDGLRRSDRIGLAVTPAAAEMLDMTRLVEEVTQRVSFYSARCGVDFARPFIEVRDLGLDAPVFQIELDEVAIHASTLVPGTVVTDASPDQLRSLDIAAPETVVDWIVSVQPRRFVPQGSEPALRDAGLSVTSIEVALAECLFRSLENAVRILFGHVEYEELISAARQADEATIAFVTEHQSQQNLVRIFRYLLEDGVPLRPRRLLFESLAHWIHLHPEADPVFIAECLRNSLKRQLCHNLANSQGELALSMLAPALEERILNDLKHIKTLEEGAEIDNLPLDAELSDLITGEARKLGDLDTADDRRVAIVAAPNIRRRLRNFLAHCGINIPIISPHEISADITTMPIAVLGEGFDGPRMSEVSKEARIGALFPNKPAPKVLATT